MVQFVNKIPEIYSSEQVRNAFDEASTRLVNFSVLKEDRTAEVVYNRYEVWHASQDELGSVPAGALGYVRQDPPNTQGDIYPDIFLTDLGLNRRSSAITDTIIHETLHFSREIDRVSDQAMDRHLQELSDDDKIIARRIIEEKLLRDGISAAKEVANLPRAFTDHHNVVDILLVSYEEMTFSDGREITLSTEAEAALRVFFDTEYDPVDIQVNGQNYQVNRDLDIVAIDYDGNPIPGGAIGERSAWDAFVDGVSNAWDGFKQGLKEIGDAIKQGWNDFVDWISGSSSNQEIAERAADGANAYSGKADSDEGTSTDEDQQLPKAQRLNLIRS